MEKKKSSSGRGSIPFLRRHTHISHIFVLRAFTRAKIRKRTSSFRSTTHMIEELLPNTSSEIGLPITGKLDCIAFLNLDRSILLQGCKLKISFRGSDKLRVGKGGVGSRKGSKNSRRELPLMSDRGIQVWLRTNAPGKGFFTPNG